MVQPCLRSSFGFWPARSLRASHERGWDQSIQTFTDSMGRANEEQPQTQRAHTCGRDAKLTIKCPSARRVVHRRTRSFTAVKGLSRHILARGAAVFHGPLDGCALLRGAVVPITGNSADREYFRDREASVRRRAAARSGWRRERRWGSAPHPGLSRELFFRGDSPKDIFSDLL